MAIIRPVKMTFPTSNDPLASLLRSGPAAATLVYPYSWQVERC